MKVLLIIPAYNEEENILRTCKSIDEYNKKAKSKLDYLVINDGSKDKTLEILIKNKINHINLIQNLGIGGAVQTGYKYAKEHDYDIAVQFDGDGQHDVNYVQDIIDPIIKKNVDFTIGSRFVTELSKFKSTLSRRMGIKLISFFIRLFTKTKVHDTTSGFRAVNKEIINEFSNSYPTEYPEPVSTTELLKKGYRLKEIPVSMNERIGGVSSIRAWKNVYYMLNVILSIFVVSLRRYK